MVLGGAIAGAIGAAASGLAGGLLDTGQSPAKLEIIPTKPPSKLEPITVPFNPNSYSITKSVNWTPTQTANGQDTETERNFNAPRLQPSGGDSRILTLELFFDVTENPDISDVRTQTNEIVKLTQIERDTGQPPICELRWGKPIGSDFPFIGVVTNLVQNFTLFRRNGEPVRARLTVTFKEYLDPEQDQRQTDPELTTRIVKRGDTLSSIAAEVYGNPTLWRAIAEANHLDNPRHLEPGKTLSIPELR